MYYPMAKTVGSTSVYNSWKAAAIFLLLLIFQPVYWTFFAFRPSDVWLLWCLVNQEKQNETLRQETKLWNFFLYFGIVMGGLSVLGSVLQFLQFDAPIKGDIFFQFYKWSRFSLIFLLISNISITEREIKKLVFFFFSIVVLYLPFV